MSLADPAESLRLFEESLPVFVVVFLWAFLAEFALPGLRSELRTAGIVMALLYVVVRGSAIGRRGEAPDLPESVVETLRDNVRALVPALPWFLLVFALGVVEPYTGGPLFLVYVAATTGVLTVLLYAVTFGSARLLTT